MSNIIIILSTSRIYTIY